jgi:hypothetical protein
LSVSRMSEEKPHFCKNQKDHKHSQIWQGFVTPFCVLVQLCLASLKKSGKIINRISR